MRPAERGTFSEWSDVVQLSSVCFMLSVVGEFAHAYKSVAFAIRAICSNEPINPTRLIAFSTLLFVWTYLGASSVGTLCKLGG
jgi:hypothetical protein